MGIDQNRGIRLVSSNAFRDVDECYPVKHRKRMENVLLVISELV